MSFLARTFALSTLVLAACSSDSGGTGSHDDMATGTDGGPCLGAACGDASAGEQDAAVADGAVAPDDGDGSVVGGDGDGSVVGGDGDGSVTGGDGDGSVTGGDGDGSVTGGDGDGSVTGGDGDGSVTGGDGDGSVTGGDGDGSVTGGDGDASVVDGDASSPECTTGQTEREACAVGERTRSCVAGSWGPWSECSSVPECSGPETRACGINRRGTETRPCVDGTWGEWQACEDSDVCKDEASEGKACGLNGAGMQLRRCDHGTWSEWSACVDTDVCENGKVESEVCGLNDAGTRTRTCGEGKWAEWTECVNSHECRNGATERVPCGPNLRGLSERTCSQGHWGEFGACVDQDVCKDDAAEQRTCGLNGTQRRTCHTGTWSEWSECHGEDACESGVREERKCGRNLRGEQERVCSAGEWGEFGACDDPDECKDDAQEERACGLNERGTETRTCEAGKWSDFGACVDPDVCEDGTETERACGLNKRGVEKRVCENGMPGEWGACVDPDVCVDDDSETVACGFNQRGTDSRTCVDGRWSAFEGCQDPDECRNDSKSSLVCGLNRRGTAERLCADGKWQAWSACSDPDECIDDRVEREPCGPGNAGERTRTCTVGAWAAWSECSVLCGNASIEAPETCDDANTNDGDGCSADCRIERVEWMYQIPGGANDSSNNARVRSDGTFVTWLNDRSDFASSLTKPRVVAVNAQGKPAFTYDFEVTDNKSFKASAMAIGPADETILYGRFRGQSQGLGNYTRETIFLHTLGREGFVRSSARLIHTPSGQQPSAYARVIAPNGDLTIGGDFSFPEDVQLYNTVVPYQPFSGRGYFMLRVNAPSLDERFTYSFDTRASNNTPDIDSLAADDHRQVMVMRESFPVRYSFPDGQVIEGLRGLILGLTNQGATFMRYALPDGLGIAYSQPNLLPSGDVVVQATLYPGGGLNGTSTLVDATGPQTVKFDTYVLWFDASGVLRLVRPGHYAGMVESTMLVWDTFAGSVQLEAGEPWETTISAEEGDAGVYLAGYQPDGVLSSAALLMSRKGTHRSDDYALQLGGDTLYVEASCAQEMRAGQGDDAVDLSGFDTATCLATYDATGALRWARREVTGLFGVSDAYVHDGAVWTREYGRIKRYDPDGTVGFDLRIDNDQLVVNEQGVWARSRLTNVVPQSLVFGDPAEKVKLDAKQGAVVILKLRE